MLPGQFMGSSVLSDISVTLAVSCRPWEPFLAIPVPSHRHLITFLLLILCRDVVSASQVDSAQSSLNHHVALPKQPVGTTQ